MHAHAATEAAPGIRDRPVRAAAGRRGAATCAEKIAIRNLDFYYGDIEALKGINLPLYDRKVTAFIGPSGCGKSTLLRVLNRMYEPLSRPARRPARCCSTARTSWRPGIDLNLLRAKVGMVFQKPTPFPMSIYDNIAFGIRLLREACHGARWTSASSGRCAAPRCGTR